MKIHAASLCYIVLDFIWPAASFKLRGHSQNLPPVAAVSAVNTSGQYDPFANDPALGIVASSNGGDYFTQAYTAENVGDPSRGDGTCKMWRRTLKCNPSGPRDPKKDRTCTDVVPAGESGYCECGGFVQFAAVDCDHRPFTCEVMCLKFAVITGKPVTFRGQNLLPTQAQSELNKVMWANQTDLEAMRTQTQNMKDWMDQALVTLNGQAANATQAMQKFLDMMKKAHDVDKQRAAEAMQNHTNSASASPWMMIYKNGQKMIDAGRGIQAKVAETLPFDPLTANKYGFNDQHAPSR